MALLVSDFGCLSPAAAKDGGSDSSGHGSGSSDSGGSSGSGSNSGSGSGSGSSGSSGHGGSDNSGHGSTGSDDNSGHGNADDDDSDDSSTSNSSGNTAATSDKSGNDDHDRARNAVRDGRVLPLKTVLEKIDAGRLGRIIDVDLSHSLAGDIYRLKVRDTKGAIKTFRVDARSGTLLKGN